MLDLIKLIVENFFILILILYFLLHLLKRYKKIQIALLIIIVSLSLSLITLSLLLVTGGINNVFSSCSVLESS